MSFKKNLSTVSHFKRWLFVTHCKMNTDETFKVQKIELAWYLCPMHDMVIIRTLFSKLLLISDVLQNAPPSFYVLYIPTMVLISVQHCKYTGWGPHAVVSMHQLKCEYYTHTQVAFAAAVAFLPFLVLVTKIKHRLTYSAQSRAHCFAVLTFYTAPYAEHTDISHAEVGPC